MSALVDKVKDTLNIGTSTNNTTSSSTMSSDSKIPQQWKAGVVKEKGKIEVDTVKGRLKHARLYRHSWQRPVGGIARSTLDYCSDLVQTVDNWRDCAAYHILEPVTDITLCTTSLCRTL